MRNTTVYVIVVVSLLIGAMGGYFGASMTTTGNTATTTKTITTTSITTTTAGPSSPATVALKMGYLAIDASGAGPVMQAVQTLNLGSKYGLNLSLTGFTDNPTMNSAFFGGSLDANLVSVSAVDTATAQGRDVLLVYPTERVEFSLFVRNDSSFKSFLDLKGRSIAATGTLPGSTFVLSSAIYKSQGAALSVSDFKYVSVPPPVALNQLKSGQVDGAEFFEPFRSQAKASPELRMIADGTQLWKQLTGRDLWVIGIAVQKSFAVAHPDAVRRLIQMYKEGVTYVLNNPDFFKQWANKAGITDPKVVQILTNSLFESAMPGAYTNFIVQDYQLYAQILQDVGLVKGTVPPGVFTNEYAS